MNLIKALLNERLSNETAEFQLTELRASLTPNSDPALLEAMGVFCFHHEYVLAGEREADGLLDSCYRPIPSPIPGADRLNHVQYCEPQIEAGLVPVILSTPDTPVRAQYEENPYPRWWGDLQAIPSPNDKSKKLIAGCGTGRQAIIQALSAPESGIVALDLSRRSLQFAMREAQDRGVTNVQWLQGDILDLCDLGQRFDQIQCAGVLHHMPSPGTGLTALADVLEDGGSIKVSVYTQRSIDDLGPGREIARNYPPTPEGIRAFRQEIFRFPTTHPARDLTTRAEFYTVSECRDLVFHVQEQGFTFQKLGELADSAGLQIERVYAVPDAASLFRERFPEATGVEMEKWADLETTHPHLFGRMHQIVLGCR